MEGRKTEVMALKKIKEEKAQVKTLENKVKTLEKSNIKLKEDLRRKLNDKLEEVMTVPRKRYAIDAFFGNVPNAPS